MRQNIILENVVNLFVKNGKPVGSSTILEISNLNCSSATIRQEMSILEQLGFLEQPHTSGGRIPTTSGLQYYVDNLLKERKISLNARLNDIFRERNKKINVILEEAAKIISEVTNLTTIVIKPEDANEFVEKIQFNKLSDHSAVLIIITNKGNVQNKAFNLKNEKQTKDLQALITILNDRLKGTLISELKEKLNAIKPIIKNNIKDLESIFQSFVIEMIALTKSSSYTSGEFNLVRYSELDQNKIAKIIDMIQNHSSFEQFVKEQKKDILIGDQGTSVIKHEYNIKGSKGHIALIGPTRMEYDKINSLLDTLVERIEAYTEKGE